MCLVLLFIDQKNSKDLIRPRLATRARIRLARRRGDSSGWGDPFSKTQQLNSFLSQQKGDGYMYPRNATGYFRGNSVSCFMWQPSGHLYSISCFCFGLAGSWSRLTDLVLPSGHNQTADTGSRVVLNHRDGRFDMQLYMNTGGTWTGSACCTATSSYSTACTRQTRIYTRWPKVSRMTKSRWYTLVCLDYRL